LSLIIESIVTAQQKAKLNSYLWNLFMTQLWGLRCNSWLFSLQKR